MCWLFLPRGGKGLAGSGAASGLAVAHFEWAPQPQNLPIMALALQVFCCLSALAIPESIQRCLSCSWVGYLCPTTYLPRFTQCQVHTHTHTHQASSVFCFFLMCLDLIDFSKIEFLEKRYNRYCRGWLAAVCMVEYVVAKISVFLYAATIMFRYLGSLSLSLSLEM